MNSSNLRSRCLDDAHCGEREAVGLLNLVRFDFQYFSNFAFAFTGEFPLASSNWELAWTFRVLW